MCFFLLVVLVLCHTPTFFPSEEGALRQNRLRLSALPVTHSSSEPSPPAPLDLRTCTRSPTTILPSSPCCTALGEREKISESACTGPSFRWGCGSHKPSAWVALLSLGALTKRWAHVGQLGSKGVLWYGHVAFRSSHVEYFACRDLILVPAFLLFGPCRCAHPPFPAAAAIIMLLPTGEDPSCCCPAAASNMAWMCSRSESLARRNPTRSNTAIPQSAHRSRHVKPKKLRYTVQNLSVFPKPIYAMGFLVIPASFMLKMYVLYTTPPLNPSQSQKILAPSRRVFTGQKWT
jgi:hypothetical protein